MRQREEAHLEGDFAHAAMRVAQQDARAFHAQAGAVFGEAQSGVLVELFAAIVAADVQVPRQRTQRDGFGQVLRQKFPRLADERRLGVLGAEQEPFSLLAQLLGELVQQNQQCLLLARAQSDALAKSVTQRPQIRLHAQLLQPARGLAELRRPARAQRELSGEEMAEQGGAMAHRHGDVHQSERTAECCGGVGGGGRQLQLLLGAGGAGRRMLGNALAEPIFIGATVQVQLPMISRAQ